MFAVSPLRVDVCTVLEPVLHPVFVFVFRYVNAYALVLEMSILVNVPDDHTNVCDDHWAGSDQGLTCI